MRHLESLYERGSQPTSLLPPPGRRKSTFTDPEKQADDDYDTDDRSSVTSTPIHSPKFLLHAEECKYSPTSMKSCASRFLHRAPRRFSRYFSLAVLSALALLIIMLMYQSRRSARSVKLGLSRPPPPPPVWESFPFLKRYHGGLRTLVSKDGNIPEYPISASRAGDKIMVGNRTADEQVDLLAQTSDENIPSSIIFDPYPMYASGEYEAKYGHFKECLLDEENGIKVPELQAFPGVPSGMPENVMGSYKELGIRDDLCFERYGRLGPYGFGYSVKRGGTGAGTEGHSHGRERVWAETSEIDYRTVKWSEVQQRCGAINNHRFKPKIRGVNHFYKSMAIGGPVDETHSKGDSAVEAAAADEKRTSEVVDGTPSSSTETEKATITEKGLPRTAVLIRTWSDFQYDAEDILYLRAIITELALRSGGEYTISFLIHVRNDNLQIWADEDVYQKVLDDALPEEFRGMGTLWSERQMGLIYGGLQESFYRDLPVHGVYRSSFMPVQYFAQQHPEYDFFWHWEMDSRYTGNFYHLFDSISKWAAVQPRKGLWERNSRFYIPQEHGTWDEFKHMVRIQTEHGTSSKNNLWSKMRAPDAAFPDTSRPHTGIQTPIWGPQPPLDDEIDTTNDPQPPRSFKEDNYEWGVGEEADLITLNPIFNPDGTHWILADDVTGYNTTQGLPPRRASIVAAGRLSRRLLETMHRETSIHRHTMFTEMWPASCALHHGLKAVYAPHPVFIDRQWPTDYLATVFNGGLNGASGGVRMSVFSDERQHNFLGTTWYYHAGFAPNLWKRWLGSKVNNDGGEEYELHGEGRMCLPPMLLHPVKQVDLVYEHIEGE